MGAEIDLDQCNLLITKVVNGDNDGGSGARLLMHDELMKIARENDSAVATLPLYVFRKYIGRGDFCLSSSKAIVSPGLTLSEYASLQSDPEEEPNPLVLSLYWKSYLFREDNDKERQAVLEKLLEDLDTKAPDEEHRLEFPNASGRRQNLDNSQWCAILNGNRLLFGSSIDPESYTLIATLTTTLQEDLAHTNAQVQGTLDALTQAQAKPTNDPETKDAVKKAQKAYDDTTAKQRSSQAAFNASAWQNDGGYGLVRKGLRPAFAIKFHPDSKSDQDDNGKVKDNGRTSFWAQPDIPATTRIIQTDSRREQWLFQSNFNKVAADASIAATFSSLDMGAKYGFEHEHKSSSSEESTVEQLFLNAVHTVPVVRLVLDETTLKLSPECDEDLKQLRKYRQFSKLVKFYRTYGAVIFQDVTLGGQLTYTEDKIEITQQNVYEEPKKTLHRAQISLGIPTTLVGKISGEYQKGSQKIEGDLTTEAVQNLVWTATGGNPSSSTDPPKWRSSVQRHQNWRVIKQDRAIALVDLIGRISGFEDIPGLFQDILNCSTLNPSMLSLPPYDANLKSNQETLMMELNKGLKISASTGVIAEDPSTSSSYKEELGVKGGITWRTILSDRDLQAEITTNLQATFNTAVNLPHSTSEQSANIQSPGTLDPDSQNPATPAPTAPVPTTDAHPDDYQITGIISRAWAIGVWQVSNNGKTPDHVFEAIRLKTLKYFSTPRRLEEGCDFLAGLDLLARQLQKDDVSLRFQQPQHNVSIQFNMFASDGLTGKEEAYELDFRQAITQFQRQMRLRRVNSLPVTAELKLPSTPSWKITEAGALYWLEAMSLSIFLQDKMKSLEVLGGGGTSESLSSLTKFLKEKIVNPGTSKKIDVEDDNGDVFPKGIEFLNLMRAQILQGQNLSWVSKYIVRLQSLELQLGDFPKNSIVS
ncbi:hypothetical protein F4777DRAFT_598448 [Nemania sp. FL0916]|nr:hypothetical protein F4777DRAFT_598448 [Nemania sp. FL0916]